MPIYRVRLTILDDQGDPSGCAWHTLIPVAPFRFLDNAEIEARARARAVKNFGDHASEWPLLDAVRTRS